MQTTGNKIVDAISRLGINSIPDAWYQNLRRKNSKTLNSLAVLVLWDLLYWYKWTEVKDETSGLVIGYKKKFKADLLQRSYSAIADKFGVTKRVAMDTVIFLEELGVIRKECRTITVGNQKLGNVLFIALVPEKIAEISEFKTLERNTSYAETEDLLRSDVIAITPERKTNTITSTINSTTTSTPSSHSESTPFDDDTSGSEDSLSVSSSSPNPFDEPKKPAKAQSHSVPAAKKTYPKEYYSNALGAYMTNYKTLLDSGKVKSPLPKIAIASTRSVLKKAFDAYGYETILDAIKKSVNDQWLIDKGYDFFNIFGPRKLVMLINNQTIQKNTAVTNSLVKQSLNGNYEGDW